MKWSDVLRVKSEFPINLWPNAVQAYHRWIRTSHPRQRARTTGSPASCSPPAAATSAMPPVNFYRAVQSREPHGHRVGRGADVHGRADRRAGRRSGWRGMAAFFSQIGYKPTRRVEGGDRLLRSRQARCPGADAGGSRAARVFPDGTQRAPGARPGSARGLRRVADRADEPVVRAGRREPRWFWLLGRGIVHEPDDIRPDNPPSQSRAAGVPRARAGRVAVRPEARLPADPQLDAPISCRRFRGVAPSRAGGQLRVLR